MKNLLALAMVFGFSALGLECRFTADTFEVKSGDATYTQKIRAEYLDRRVWCGAEAAAVYDGSDLVVFDAQDGRFLTKTVNLSDLNVVLSGAGKLLVFADSKNLWVYDATQKDFFSEVTTRFSSAQLVVSEKLAGYYAGNTLFLYFEGKKEFKKVDAAYSFQFAKLKVNGASWSFYDGDGWKLGFPGKEEPIELANGSNIKFARVELLATGSLLWDGKKVHGYCLDKNKFVEQATPAAYLASSWVDAAKNMITAVVAGETWIFNVNTCEFAKQG